jgi:malate dehydrogenase (oxaloacetate-decarboxylating)
MDETEVFAQEAADVSQQAIAEGVARVSLSREEVYSRTKADITAVRALVEDMKKLGYIKEPPQEMLQAALAKAIEAVS